MGEFDRCEWANRGPLEMSYHDLEWGVPVHDDRLLYEFLVLEGAQAGLSWSTVLRKREAFRVAFDNFDPQRIARYGERKIQDLLPNPGIIRNRAKITSVIQNARMFLNIQDSVGSFNRFIWRFVDGKPIQNAWRHLGQVPSRTQQSDEMSKDLKAMGFSFVGSTICYAYMQAVGMVNDHWTKCFRHGIVGRMA
jgi:DNA-3-methyladenine glycosylase I